MRKLLIFGSMLTVMGACSASRDTNTRSESSDSDFHPGSVSPRTESRFSGNFQGMHSYSGTNASKFNPSDVKTRSEITSAIRPDSLNKEFASDGEQVNIENF